MNNVVVSPIGYYLINIVYLQFDLGFLFFHFCYVIFIICFALYLLWVHMEYPKQILIENSRVIKLPCATNVSEMK